MTHQAGCGPGVEEENSQSNMPNHPSVRLTFKISKLRRIRCKTASDGNIDHNIARRVIIPFY